jgi:hypothetical protein
VTLAAGTEPQNRHCDTFGGNVTGIDPGTAYPWAGMAGAAYCAGWYEAGWYEAGW